MIAEREETGARGLKPLACFLAQAGIGTSFTYLTSGVFLSGIAILMGAGDVLVSYLSIILNVCGVLILLFASFFERFQSRKRLTIGLTILSRLATLFIVAIPAVIPPPARLAVFVVVVVTAFTLQAQTSVVLNQWMLGFMDEKKSGRYVSLRQTMAIVVTIVLSIIGGYWMDYKGGQYAGFLVLFAAAAAMAVCEVALLARTPDSAPYQSRSNGYKLRDIVLIPLRDVRYIKYVLYVALFYMFLYISDSFTMVYMMKYLALPYKTVNVLYMIIFLPQIVLLSMWGRISDQKGHDFALKTSISFFVGETLFMLFAGPNTWFIFIPAAFIMASIGNAGFIISVFNRRYELMPAENRVVYDNFYTAAIGLSFIFGPMIGGGIKDIVEHVPALMNSMTFANIRLLYPVASIGIVILQIVCFRAGGKKRSRGDVQN